MFVDQNPKPGFSFAESDVAWSRMAEPQPDGYDLQYALALGKLERAFDDRSVASPVRTFDGTVAVLSGKSAGPREAAPADHPNLARAVEIIRAWPEIFRQCQQFLRAVHVFASAEETSSTDDSARFGHIRVAIDDPVNAAVSLLQGMVSQKLFLFGVQQDTAERLITNSPDEQFPDPVCPDRLRPMSAVFSSVYGLTHVVELLSQTSGSTQATDNERHRAAELLADKLAMLDFGIRVLEESTSFDQAGRDFIRGYSDWNSRVRTKAAAVLASLGTSPKQFRHPLTVAFGGDVRPQHATGIQSCRMLDETLVTLPERKTAYSLNSSVTLIWDLCDGKKTLDEITEAIAAGLGLDDSDTIEELRSDVQKSVARLLQAGLLSVLNATPTVAERMDRTR